MSCMDFETRLAVFAMDQDRGTYARAKGSVPGRRRSRKGKTLAGVLSMALAVVVTLAGLI